MYAARASDREERITVAGRCWAGGERNFFFDDGDGRGDRHIGIQRVHNNVSCTYIYIYIWYAYNTVGRGGVGEECDVAVTYYAAAAAAVGMLTPPSSECILWKRPSTRREAYCTSSESRVFRLRRGSRERLLLPRGVFGGGRNSGLGGIG